MKYSFVGFAFAVLALTFTATAGYSWNNGYGNGHNAGYGNAGYGNGGYGNAGFNNAGFGNGGYGNAGYGNGGYGNAGFGNGGFGYQSRNRGSDVGRAVRRLTSEVLEAVGLKPENDHHRFPQGNFRQPRFMIQTHQVIVPVPTLVPVRPVRRYRNNNQWW